jgi:D-tagatose-1,6-bisphosphate aldolase subunit GatZ/KbaZ
VGNPIKKLIKRRQNGQICGIVSYCTANELVLEAVLERANVTGEPVLIEATANQVNQYGGYTGMCPQDFAEFIWTLAKKTGVDKGQIFLGGDHLGPLLWVDEVEGTAMEKARELVRSFVMAGFSKIHLDTSMRLGSDSRDIPISTELVARRGVYLYKACIEAYEERRSTNPQALRPVFVIGSEVPIPGGALRTTFGSHVTDPEDLENTIAVYKSILIREGLKSGWEDVVAIVAEPGVEFGDTKILFYDHAKAASLLCRLPKHPEIILEGHSTDYQTKECLQDMVADGIAILKVGPALTFSLREALFSLSYIEKTLIPENRQSGFMEKLDSAMLAKPRYWENHYCGTAEETALARKYSFSDRSRYYMGEKSVVAAMETLFDNLRSVALPLNLLRQYMPFQYEKAVRQQGTPDPRDLAKESVWRLMETYSCAVGAMRE